AHLADLPWLTILIAVPAVAAALVWLVPPLRKSARPFALAASLAGLIGPLGMTAGFHAAQAAPYQPPATYPWTTGNPASRRRGPGGRRHRHRHPAGRRRAHLPASRVHGAAAAPGSDDDRRVLRTGSLPVLPALRGDPAAHLLHDRQLRRTRPPRRCREVPA